MISGPALVINGTLVGGVFLSLFLFSVTAGAAYPAPPPPASQSVSPLHASQGDEFSNLSGTENQVASEMSDPHSGCQVSQRYPNEILQWCELITRYASQRGLSPDLLAALVWQESRGDPLAYSRSGAVGLMQVMPSDGLAAGFMCVNGPCFSSRPTTAELHDPEFNVAFGTKMLAGLLKKNGSLREALKAYGPMDVGYSYADKVMGIFQNFRKND